MSGIDELKAKLELPPVSQIGIIVKNMGRSVQYFSSMFGIGPFTVYEFVPEKQWFMEKISPAKYAMGKAFWGNIEIELIQPLEGKSLHMDFLKSQGEGLHHLGFNARNYEDLFKKFIREGFQPLLRAETYVETYKGHLKACYFDTQKVGGVLFEIIWKSWLPECNS